MIDPKIPNWAGPAPASVSNVKDLQRKTSTHERIINTIPPESITFDQLAADALSGIHDTIGPLYGGVGGEPGGGPDKALYVRTDDGDGGASRALWQYEGGAWMRVGVAEKHASQHASGGSDPVTTADIGAVATANVYTQVLTSNLSAIAAQTTLQNITGLTLAISSSSTEIWLVKYWLDVSAANTAMDSKFGFTVPASCTMRGGSIEGSGTAPPQGGWVSVTAATTPPSMLNAASTPVFGTLAGTNGIVLVYKVFGGGTAGNVQIQYAQNTSDAGNLQILKGSCMEAVKLAA